MIRKMLLNRTNRVFIRKRRLVKNKAALILRLLLQKQNDLLNSKDLSAEDLKLEIMKLQNIFKRFEQLDLIKV